jgi:transposase-like protein
VVGVIPNSAAVERLLGAVLMGQDEEWRAADRRYRSFDELPASESG